MVYGTLSGFRAFALARGNAAPTAASDVLAQAALQRGSDYVRRFYAGHLVRAVSDEVLEEAAYIAAGYELTTPGFFSRTYTPAEAKVLTAVGAIRWTPVGDASRGGSLTPVSSDIEALLGDCVRRSGGPGLGLWAVGP